MTRNKSEKNSGTRSEHRKLRSIIDSFISTNSTFLSELCNKKLEQMCLCICSFDKETMAHIAEI